MSTQLKITEHDTSDELFAALTHVFTEQVNGGTRWVNFKSADGVEFTFFAKHDTAKVPE